MTLRQWHVIEELKNRIAEMPEYLGVLLLGSCAAGTADAVSDVDLMLVVRPGEFERAWERRSALHAVEPLVAWDVRKDAEAEIGAHKWITTDLIMVECLIATPGSGVRLAEPFIVLTGEPNLTDMLTRRPPIRREEMRTVANTPGEELESAYDEFKALARRLKNAGG